MRRSRVDNSAGRADPWRRLLALSFRRLIKAVGYDLHVTDFDAVCATPNHDIARYFEQMGPRGPVTQLAWPGEKLDPTYWAAAADRTT